MVSFFTRIALAFCLCATCFFITCGQVAFAQSSKSKSLNLGFGGLGDDFGDPLSSTPFEYDASFEVEEGGLAGRVTVNLTLESGHHTFSTTQPAGGPSPTVINITSPGVTLSGPFSPNNSFEISLKEEGFEGLRCEIHHDSVSWTAPVKFEKPVSDPPAPIKVKVNAQVCKSSCIPVQGLELNAKFKGYYAAAKSAASNGPFREQDSPIEWTVVSSKSIVKSGDKFELVLSAKPDKGYHIYKYDPADITTESRTLIVLTQKAGLISGSPRTNDKLIHKNLGGGIEVDYYTGNATWRIPLQVPDQAIQGIYPLQGLIGYQGCTDVSCDNPRGIRFQVDLNVGPSSKDEPTNAVLTSIPYKDVAQNPNLTKWIDGSKIKLTLSAFEILTKFCLAMVGGLILNFMPCVLPVIGLKVLGFVSEAGGDRKTASMLTLTYSAGIVSLVLALGLLSVLVRAYTGTAYGWGQQFGSIEFRVVITAFMFSLALSFLGVWEIPIPGFAMSKTSTELSNREGYTGAFFKGIITTVLATPCSAPFLGGVFVVALSQPAWVVLLIFLGVGLGMALPYLAVAAQPSLLSALPKPGPWMQTFKEVLAFPMLLSVVFLVSGFLDKDRMSMLSALMFVWFGCWMVGRIPAWAETGTKVKGWLIAGAVALAGTYGSFYLLQPSKYSLAWQEYEESKLDKLVADGKTVMIDFTANWCQNCKLNLRVALETKKVKELVESESIVPMVADMTNYPPNVQAKLNELNSISIPVVAIYSGSDPDNPIILRDLLTESDVLEALKSAGNKKNSESRPTAATAPKSASVQ
ncbi:MAG: protein-disulfide reductase DsbD domain-containing protein [Pirellula sp.]